MFRAARWLDSSSRKYAEFPHFADLDWIGPLSGGGIGVWLGDVL